MEEGPSRKLAVILHADVVGSTALVQANETIAHERIRDTFQRFSQAIDAQGGTAHEIRGDALVAEFSKASDAVEVALSFQAANAAHNQDLLDEIRPVVRVGIAMGEVVVADDTLTGEAVVLAQRLEQLAEPGGVCIHGTAQDTVPKRLPFTYENLGERKLKGFDEPVRVFRVVLRDDEIQSAASAEDTSSLASSGAASESRTSLAVLPFNVIGGSPETESLADGLTDVVINTVSRTGMMEIVDRASTFAFKGQSPRPVDVAKALGVKHVLQGTVQQSGARARITAELFNVEANSHVWSERFDRTVEDVFEFQDDIAKRITQSVRTVVVYGTDWEVPTDNFDVWLLNVRYTEFYLKGSAKDNRETRKGCEKVMALDPNFFWGPSTAASTHLYDCIYGWSKSAKASLEKSVALTEQLLQIDAIETFPWRYYQVGSIRVLQGEHDTAVEMAEKQLELLPDEGGVMSHIGWIHCLSGDPKRAEIVLSRSIEISQPWWTHLEWLGLAHLLCGDQHEALSALDRACGLAADPTFPHALKGVAYVELDKPESANTEMRRALALRPELTL